MLKSLLRNGTAGSALTPRTDPKPVTKSWVRAGDLKPGDEIILADGSTAVVESVKADEKTSTVHNFAVDVDHTYFVGEMGAWVHNSYQPASAIESTPQEGEQTTSDEVAVEGTPPSSRQNSLHEDPSEARATLDLNLDLDIELDLDLEPPSVDLSLPDFEAVNAEAERRTDAVLERLSQLPAQLTDDELYPGGTIEERGEWISPKTGFRFSMHELGDRERRVLRQQVSNAHFGMLQLAQFLDDEMHSMNEGSAASALLTEMMVVNLNAPPSFTAADVSLVRDFATSISGSIEEFAQHVDPSQSSTYNRLYVLDLDYIPTESGSAFAMVGRDVNQVENMYILRYTLREDRTGSVHWAAQFGIATEMLHMNDFSFGFSDHYEAERLMQFPTYRNNDLPSTLEAGATLHRMMETWFSSDHYRAIREENGR